MPGLNSAFRGPRADACLTGAGIMSKSAPKSPAKPAARQDRLAAALRANLKRRKAHSRQKAQAGDAGGAAAAEGPSGGRPNLAQKPD